MNTRPMLTLEEEAKLLQWIKQVSSKNKNDKETVERKQQSLRQFLLEKPHYLNYGLPSYLGEPPLFEEMKNSPLCAQMIIEEETLHKAITSDTWVRCFEARVSEPSKDATDAELKYTATGIYMSAFSCLPLDIFYSKMIAPDETAIAALIRNALKTCIFLITLQILASIPVDIFNKGGKESVSAAFLKMTQGLTYLGVYPEVYAAISDDVIEECMHLCEFKTLLGLAAKHPYLNAKIVQFFPVHLQTAIHDASYHACVINRLDCMSSLTTESLFAQDAKDKSNIAVQLFTTDNGVKLLLASSHLRSLINEDVLNLKLHGLRDIVDGITIGDYITGLNIKFARLLTLLRKEGKAEILDKFTACSAKAKPDPAKLFTPPPGAVNRVNVKSAGSNLKIKWD